jgi:hypothetical protein
LSAPDQSTKHNNGIDAALAAATTSVCITSALTLMCSIVKAQIDVEYAETWGECCEVVKVACITQAQKQLLAAFMPAAVAAMAAASPVYCCWGLASRT